MSSESPSALAEAWLELPDGKLFWLAGRCAIGRHDDNDLVLNSTALSRHHALLTAGRTGYSLTDLRSSNGTYVNRTAVTRPVTLSDADEIRIGDVILRYRCSRRIELSPSDSGPQVTRQLNDVGERTCWLLLADIANYSGLIAQVGSEAALRRLQTWIGETRPLLEQNAGVINSYVGDGVFAWWPADKVAPASVLAAIQAFEAYRPRSPLPFRIVVHHGSALFTRSERGEELVGRDVNFVFRSEKIAKRLGTSAMLSEPAVQSLKVGDRCVSVGSSVVDGIAGEHVFFAPKLA